MQLTQSAKFWLIFLLVLVAALLGGVLGNWIFIYLLDKYYGIPGGNYLAGASVTPVIVRDSKRVVVEQDNRIAQAVTAAELGFVRIFKKQNGDSPVYQLKDALATASVITSDGWLVTTQALPETTDNWQGFEALTNDRKRYQIQTVVIDPLSQLTFIHLREAQNLSVRNFVSGRDLAVAQTVVSVAIDSSVEVGRLSVLPPALRSSDSSLYELAISDIGSKQAYLFDVTGQMIGISQGKKVLAVDAVQTILEKLLTEKRIVRARLGVRYLDLSQTLTPGFENGALIAAGGKDEPAIVPESPAEKAGLKAGDIIVSVDDVALNRLTPLFSLVQEYSPKDTIDIVFRRNGQEKTISVTLDELMNK